MSKHEHVVSFRSGFPEAGWSAHCDCGWVGRTVSDQALAFDEWQDHCDVEFMEATLGTEREQ